MQRLNYSAKLLFQKWVFSAAYFCWSDELSFKYIIFIWMESIYLLKCNEQHPWWPSSAIREDSLQLRWRHLLLFSSSGRISTMGFIKHGWGYFKNYLRILRYSWELLHRRRRPRPPPPNPWQLSQLLLYRFSSKFRLFFHSAFSSLQSNFISFYQFSLLVVCPVDYQVNCQVDLIHRWLKVGRSSSLFKFSSRLWNWPQGNYSNRLHWFKYLTCT